MFFIVYRGGDHYVQKTMMIEETTTTTTTSHRPTASSATKELDDLMASLSDFKVWLNFITEMPVCVTRNVLDILNYDKV